MRQQIRPLLCNVIPRIALIFGALLGSCSPRERLILVDVPSWPAEADHLQVSTFLDGQPGQEQSVRRSDSVTGQQLGIYVPSERLGSLHIDARFHDDRGCRYGRGEATLVLDNGNKGNYQQTIALSQNIYAQPLCTCSDSGWCWANPLPSGNSLSKIWGSSPGDLWAVGDAGTLIHGQGADGQLRWSMASSGTTASLSDLWGSDVSDVWAVGTAGTILHWDGHAWSSVASGVNAALTAIWGSSSTKEAWAIGGRSIIYCKNSSCAPVAMPALSGNANAIAGNILNGDAWIVGSSGMMVHCFSGGTCTSDSSAGIGTDMQLVSVWISKLGAGWATGYSTKTNGGSIVLRLSGNTWTNDSGIPAMSTPLSGTAQLSLVSGTSASDVWVSGYNNTSPGGGPLLLHWDGSAWTQPVSSLTINSQRLWSLSENRAYLSDRYNVQYCKAVCAGTPCVPIVACEGVTTLPQTSINSIWPISATELWSVGYSGTILHGTAINEAKITWSDVSAVARDHFIALSGSSASDFWALGASGTLLHYVHGAWTADGPPPHNSQPFTASAILSNRADDIWVAGYYAAGTAINPAILHRTGDAAAAWTQDTSASGVATVQFKALWGNDSEHLWALGSDSAAKTQVLLRRSGSLQWLPVALPPELLSELTALWGSSSEEVWAVGRAGATVRCGSSQCSQVASGTLADLATVWGSGADDIWAGGNGTTLRWNGTAWSSLVSASPFNISRIWGSSATDLWAIGGGRLLHWDGATWAGVLPSTGFPPSLLSVAGSSAANIWAAGSSGVLLLRDL